MAGRQNTRPDGDNRFVPKDSQLELLIDDSEEYIPSSNIRINSENNSHGTGTSGSRRRSRHVISESESGEDTSSFTGSDANIPNDFREHEQNHKNPKKKFCPENEPGVFTQCLNRYEEICRQETIRYNKNNPTALPPKESTVSTGSSNQNHEFEGFSDNENMCDSPSVRNFLEQYGSEESENENRDQSLSHNTQRQASSSNQSSRAIKNPNNNNIIIIEPSKEHALDFFKNDVKLTNAIGRTAIQAAGIIDIQKNITKKLLTVKINETNATNFEKILQMKKIGEWTVQCRKPQSLNKTFGVIGPIGTDTTEEEIMDELSSDIPVLGIKRLTKGREKNLTQCVRLTFKGTDLPETVKIGYMRFSVRLFIDKPWQCYNCQNFGHNADQCHSQTRCSFCSRNHQSRECPNRNSDSEAKCPNCSGNHTSSYGGCKYIKEAKRVEKERAEKKLSYREAVMAVKNNNIINQGKSTQATSQSYHHHRGTYASAVMTQDTSENQNKTIRVEYSETSTQTEEEYPNGNNNKSFYIKMFSVFFKLVKLLPQGISKNKAQVADTLKEAFNIELTTDDIHQLAGEENKSPPENDASSHDQGQNPEPTEPAQAVTTMEEKNQNNSKERNQNNSKEKNHEQPPLVSPYSQTFMRRSERNKTMDHKKNKGKGKNHKNASTS